MIIWCVVIIRLEIETIKFFINSNFRRYVKQHNRYKLNNTPNHNHLGHPINAYHLIRHVVYGWEYISHHLSALTEKRPLTPALSKYIEIIITYVYLYIHIFSYFTLCYIFALKIQSYSEFFLSYYSSTDNKKNKC